MTTSNDYHDSKSPNPSPKKQAIPYCGEHWYELTATLSAEKTAVLADWIDDDLAAFEAKFSQFVTNGSLLKSRGR